MEEELLALPTTTMMRHHRLEGEAAAVVPENFSNLLHSLEKVAVVMTMKDCSTWIAPPARNRQ